MQLGMVGLGRMGANMVRRLIKKGHECVVFDVAPKAVSELVAGKGCGSDVASGSRKKAPETSCSLADGSRGNRGQNNR